MKKYIMTIKEIHKALKERGLLFLYPVFILLFIVSFFLISLEVATPLVPFVYSLF